MSLHKWYIHSKVSKMFGPINLRWICMVPPNEFNEWFSWEPKKSPIPVMQWMFVKFLKEKKLIKWIYLSVYAKKGGRGSGIMISCIWWKKARNRNNEKYWNVLGIRNMNNRVLQWLSGHLSFPHEIGYLFSHLPKILYINFKKSLLIPVFSDRQEVHLSHE